MKVLGMIAGSVAGWFAARLMWPGIASEVFYGMFGPLVASAATWMLVERVDRERPGKVFSVLLGGFFVKLVFFGVYVAAVFQKPALQAVPFVVSFTGYFVALYGVQAYWLSRMRIRPAR
jgi:hypothetical protein